MRRTRIHTLTAALGIAAVVAATAATAATAVPPASRSTPSPVTVTTDNETPTLYDDEEGGNASGDDPAIWVHPTDSARSVVMVTAKEGGLRVHDMDSEEAQSLPATPAPRGDGVAGRYNNVDIAYGIRLGASGLTSQSSRTATKTS